MSLFMCVCTMIDTTLYKPIKEKRSELTKSHTSAFVGISHVWLDKVAPIKLIRLNYTSYKSELSRL
jgi:hypothetical protein